MSLPSSSVPAPANSPPHVLAEPLTSQEKKRCVSAIKQSAHSRWFAATCLSGCPVKPSTKWVKKHRVVAVNQSARARWFAIAGTSQTVNQPREEASCLHCGAVCPLPLICCHTFVWCFSQTIDQPREEASCCCRWPVCPHPLIRSCTY